MEKTIKLVLFALLLISCNSKEERDKSILFFFENKAEVKFPLGTKVLNYNEDTDISIYRLSAIIVKDKISEFIANYEFQIFNDTLIGNGINFSKDDLDLSNLENYFEKKPMSIKRGYPIYILRRDKDKGSVLFVLNIETGALLGLVY